MQNPPLRPVRHFLHRMNGSDPAPTGGDTATWFRFYKWDVEGEVFAPRSAQQHLPATAGDYLWLSMDGQVVGCVELLRVLVDPLQPERQELWFEPGEAMVPNSTLTLTILTAGSTISGDEVDEPRAAYWRSTCSPRLSDSNYETTDLEAPLP